MRELGARDSNGPDLPPRDLFPIEPPDAWQGMALKWLHKQPPAPVLLDRASFPNDPKVRDVLLYGVRYELENVLVEGQSFGQGYFVEYFVLWRADSGKWRLQRLMQNESVTYSATDESDDYLEARAMRKSSRDVAKAQPRWKAAEAQWPTSRGAPMRFLFQVDLRESAELKERFTWDKSVYVFVDGSLEPPVFKIVTQDLDLQTAEQHYRQEDKRLSRTGR